MPVKKAVNKTVKKKRAAKKRAAAPWIAAVLCLAFATWAGAATVTFSVERDEGGTLTAVVISGVGGGDDTIDSIWRLG